MKCLHVTDSWSILIAKISNTQTKISCSFTNESKILILTAKIESVVENDVCYALLVAEDDQLKLKPLKSSYFAFMNQVAIKVAYKTRFYSL